MSTTTITQPTFDINTVPEEHRERVAALIPDKRIAQNYVHRSFRGVEDFTFFDVAVQQGENVMLSGPTGSSKTTVARAYAAAHGLPFALIECNAAMDPGTVVGKTWVGEGGKVEYLYGDPSLVIAYGGVLLIDEINLMHPRLTAAYHGLLSVMRRMPIPEALVTLVAGRMGTGEPQPTLFITALNPGYEGTARLNAALQNRFQIKLDWGYDREVESQLIASERLLDVAYNIRDLAEIRSPLSTNALMEFERHAEWFGMDLARDLFVAHFTPAEQAPVARALEANADAIAAEIFG